MRFAAVEMGGWSIARLLGWTASLRARLFYESPLYVKCAARLVFGLVPHPQRGWGTPAFSRINSAAGRLVIIARGPADTGRADSVSKAG